VATGESRFCLVVDDAFRECGVGVPTSKSFRHIIPRYFYCVTPRITTVAWTPYGHVMLAKRQFGSALGRAAKQERYSVTWWVRYWHCPRRRAAIRPCSAFSFFIRVASAQLTVAVTVYNGAPVH